MTVLIKSELLAYSLQESGVDEAEMDIFLDHMTDEESAALEAMLVDLLRMEVDAGRVAAFDPQTRQRSVLHSIVHGNDPSAKSLVAFSFSNASTESLFPLAGLLVSVMSMPHLGVTNLVQAGIAIRSLWNSLAILRSPEDDDAIDTARAVGVLRLKAKNHASALDPSNTDLLAETGLSSKALSAALTRLTTLNILVNTTWGGQAEDYSHACNRWRTRV